MSFLFSPIMLKDGDLRAMVSCNANFDPTVCKENVSFMTDPLHMQHSRGDQRCLRFVTALMQASCHLQKPCAAEHFKPHSHSPSSQQHVDPFIRRALQIRLKPIIVYRHSLSVRIDLNPCCHPRSLHKTASEGMIFKMRERAVALKAPMLGFAAGLSLDLIMY